MVISKISSFFVLSLWNLMKMIRLKDDYIHQVSWGLDKKWGYFTNGQFLSVCRFFSSDFSSIFVATWFYIRPYNWNLSCTLWWLCYFDLHLCSFHPNEQMKFPKEVVIGYQLRSIWDTESIGFEVSHYAIVSILSNSNESIPQKL